MNDKLAFRIDNLIKCIIIIEYVIKNKMKIYIFLFMSLFTLNPKF